MDKFAWLDPKAVGDLQAGAAGVLAHILIAGVRGWRALLAVFVCGEAAARYATPEIVLVFKPLADWRDVIAFALGFGAVLLLTGAFTLGRDFAQDPVATLKRFLPGWFAGGSK